MISMMKGSDFMIVDLFLLVLQGVLNIILLPLTVINISVDFASSIPVITQFLQVVAYVLPWSNLLPLITLVVALGFFRIAIALVKVINEIIPFF